MDTILCPHCGKQVEVSLAIKHQIEDSIRQEEQSKHQKELNQVKLELIEKAKLEAKEEFELKIKDQQNEKEELKKRNRELQEQLLEMNKTLRELKESDEKRELEFIKKLNDEIEKTKKNLESQEKEKFELEKLELKKQLDDTKKLLEEAQRKSSQKSQQLQGEVLELQLEKLLKETFQNDQIEPVEKGVTGADIRQIVKSPKGFVCGTILWESKRTKEWSNKWIDKLKDDLRAEKANIPIIVSQELPNEAKNGFGLKDGVWVCSFELILPLATILRQNLLELGYQKAVSLNRGEKADQLYSYIISHEFKQQVENIVEAYREIQEQIVKEKVAYERSWKQREAQAQRIIISTAQIYGTIQGKVGVSLPSVKGLELLDSPKEPLLEQAPLINEK